MDLSKEYKVIKSALDEINNKYYSKINREEIDISDKGKNDLVTNYDINIEKYLIDSIKSNFPNDNIISEETMSDLNIKDRNWIIDPIDGTCNFANSLPFYGTQIALTTNKKPIMAFILLPRLNELYYAEYKKGAFLNDVKISVSSNKLLEKSIVTVGDFSKSNKSAIKDQLNLYEKLYNKILRFRMFGASCLDCTSINKLHILVVK